MVVTVFTNVLTMLAYMAIAFVLCKVGKGFADHTKTLSSILVYVLSPCMVLSAFLKMDYSLERLGDIGLFFAVSLIVQCLFMGLLYVIFRKKHEDARYRIINVGAVCGNVGYFGLPLVTALFPEEPVVSCYSMAFVSSMNLLVFSMGVFFLTGQKKYISLKSIFLNPPMIALYIAIPLFVFGVNFPDFVQTPIDLLGKMVTPVCMFVLGMRLSAVKLKNLFTRPFVYVTCALKLIVFPLFAYLCVAFLPFLSDTFKISLFVMSAAPCGVIISSLAEMHGCEQENAANIVLLATIFSAATLPLLTLLVQLF